jgi:hypothetical protein
VAKYTKELAERIAELVAEGLPQKVAAAACGIGQSTFYEWRDKNPEFLELLEQKRAEAIRIRVAVIQKAAERTWQAAAWWLERVVPEEFAVRSRMTTTDMPGAGKGGYQELGYEGRLVLMRKFQEAGLEVPVEVSLIDLNG